MSALTPPSRRARRAAALLAAGTLALVAAGCGDDASSADLENGKTLFQQNCQSCHILEDARAPGGPPQGLVGPNLDDAFRGARQQGFENSQFEGVTLRWIRDAQPPMPQDLVTGQDARDVAAYVASVAGTSEESRPTQGSRWPDEEPSVTYLTD
jgi:mono/diheme cytochrome c family protein